LRRADIYIEQWQLKYLSMIKVLAGIKLSYDRLVLIAIISIAIGVHVIWLSIDKSVPSWDDAAHLTNALNYQRVISHISIFSPDWWHELWAQSPSYTAPFVYLLTVPFLYVFGKSVSAGILVNLLFIITIPATVYSLSKTVFSTQVSLWASGLCLMFPIFLNVQMMYMLDDGIVAMTCLTFWTITCWKDADTSWKSWQWCLISGLSFGCLMLSKPTGFIFLLFPSIFLIGSFIKHHNWLKILQFATAIIISWLIYGGWFGQNWVTVITSAVNANAMGTGEGDPPGNTLAGWLYYPRLLPELVSLPLLIVPIGLGIIWVFKNKIQNPIKNPKLLWLIIYCVGGYFFCSLATNKAHRFILPIFPVLGIFMAYGLNLFQTIWARNLRWATISITWLILLISLFAIPGIEGLSKPPYIGYELIHKADSKSGFPQQELIKSIAQNQPYLRSTIGMLASSHDLNGENLNLYGGFADFQVYARYFINRTTKEPKLIEQDLQYLNWYITKTGELGDIDRSILPVVEQNPQIELYKTWKMPDTSSVNLYRRKDLPIVVEPILERVDKVRLEKVTISPGSDLAVNTTYQISGDRNFLKDGILILTWRGKDRTWNHDRGIGLGELYFEHTQNQTFRITEHSVMLTPINLPLNEYQLEATYLNRQTGATFPLTVPKIEIETKQDNKFQPNSIAKLSQLSQPFARGKLDDVFKELATLNQYDPTQDYLTQARQSIEYRISRGESQLDLKYTLALTQVLQRRIQPLLENLTKIAQADAQNPYAWVYLGFVRLYNWQPQAAETAFQMADKSPTPPTELATLKIVSSIFRFDLFQAWHRWKG
jgi:4-amino-4-deoxy-L-arabinose transferase-like glycosyltransferase